MRQDPQTFSLFRTPEQARARSAARFLRVKLCFRASWARYDEAQRHETDADWTVALREEERRARLRERLLAVYLEFFCAGGEADGLEKLLEVTP